MILVPRTLHSNDHHNLSQIAIMPIAEPKAIPDDATIAKVAELKVFTEKGDQVRFGDLFEGQKTIVIFIRHFFCGVRQLNHLYLLFKAEEVVVRAVRPMYMNFPRYLKLRSTKRA
jgi:hypothetical protein